MLPGVDQGHRCQHPAQRHQAAALAQTIGPARTHQPRIVNSLEGIEFGHRIVFPAGGSCGGIFSATRIFALRARGLARTSSAGGATTFLVMILITPSRSTRLNLVLTQRYSHAL